MSHAAKLKHLFNIINGSQVMVGSQQMGDKMETECIELKRGREELGLVGGDIIVAPS